MLKGLPFPKHRSVFQLFKFIPGRGRYVHLVLCFITACKDTRRDFGCYSWLNPKIKTSALITCTM